MGWNPFRRKSKETPAPSNPPEDFVSPPQHFTIGGMRITLEERYDDSFFIRTPPEDDTGYNVRQLAVDILHQQGFRFSYGTEHNIDKVVTGYNLRRGERNGVTMLQKDVAQVLQSLAVTYPDKESWAKCVKRQTQVSKTRQEGHAAKRALAEVTPYVDKVVEFMAMQGIALSVEQKDELTDEFVAILYNQQQQRR